MRLAVGYRLKEPKIIVLQNEQLRAWEGSFAPRRGAAEMRPYEFALLLLQYRVGEKPQGYADSARRYRLSPTLKLGVARDSRRCCRLDTALLTPAEAVWAFRAHIRSDPTGYNGALRVLTLLLWPGDCFQLACCLSGSIGAAVRPWPRGCRTLFPSQDDHGG